MGNPCARVGVFLSIRTKFPFSKFSWDSFFPTRPISSIACSHPFSNANYHDFEPGDAMATKSASIGEKRKASHSEGKPSRKSSYKKEAPQSARKLWKNDDASDESDDEAASNDGSPDGEDDVAPAKKKVKQGNEDRHSSEAQSAKKFDKGVYTAVMQWPPWHLSLTQLCRRVIARVPYQAEATRQRTQGCAPPRRRTATNKEAMGASPPKVACGQGGAPEAGR